MGTLMGVLMRVGDRKRRLGQSCGMGVGVGGEETNTGHGARGSFDMPKLNVLSSCYGVWFVAATPSVTG